MGLYVIGELYLLRHIVFTTAAAGRHRWCLYQLAVQA